VVKLRRVAMRRWGLILVLLILIGIAGWGIQPPPLPSPPFQKVTVCPEGPPKCGFTSIEAAADIVTGGGIIEVLPGVYVENINIGKGLTLQGKKSLHYEQVIIKAKNPEQPTIRIDSGVYNVTILGLEIMGSNKAGIEVDEGVKGILVKTNQVLDNERGIWIKPHAQAIIDENILAGNSIAIESIAARVNIINNTISLQFGVAIHGGEVRLANNVINNSLTGVGIVADSLTPTSVTLERNMITDNLRGIEIRTGEWGAIVLKGNTLADNMLGGVVWVRSLEARDNYIINSDSSKAQREGQGLIVLATAKIDLVGNVLIGNDASGLILGLSQSGGIKVEKNVVLNNGGYGLALLNPNCIHTYVIELLETIIPEEEWDEIEDKLYQGQLQDEVEGNGNLVTGNKEGDLCPEDYPWPPGFVKEDSG